MFKTALILARHAVNNRKGVTAAEYAVLAAAVVLVVATAGAALATKISTKFGSIMS